jgi:hypothetical protein
MPGWTLFKSISGFFALVDFGIWHPLTGIRWKVTNAAYWLFQIPAQILENVLFASLDVEQDGLRHSSVVLSRMHLARFQENFPQIGDAFLRQQHLSVGLDHFNSSSTIQRFPKLLEVW